MNESREQRDAWTIGADATVDLGELGCGDLVMEMSKAIAGIAARGCCLSSAKP